MRSQCFPIFLYISFVFLSLTGCVDKHGRQNKEKRYISIDDRDTTRIRITTYPTRFHGEMTNTRPGGFFVSGEIQGNVKGDTLVGDYNYKPYKWREKKRVPFAILMKDGKYLEGKGKQLIYMGIPYYVEGTISFDDPARIFVAE
ncbi:hypothetical protein [Sphingobacterium sp.]|uniref:hypothetical protein n=1 Tax=Sphingobacterium sp. TaxID=341027 RepID=UPI0028A19A26|nr:hypothetical protein [Sphingobacterium sp.]